MTLSSLLLGASSKGGKLQKPIDNELDALFRSNVLTVQKHATSAAISISTVVSTKDPGAKSKIRGENTTGVSQSIEDGTHNPKRKRKRFDSGKDGSPKKSKLEVKGKLKADEGATVGRGKVKAKAKKIAEQDDDDNAYLEDGYLAGKVADIEKPNQDDSDTEGEPARLVHESLSGSKSIGSRLGAKLKYTPADETPEQRDFRTIFVGNIPLEVAQKRPLLKRLQRHILAQVTLAKIESTRFRSVPFQSPTSKLPTAEDNGASEKHPPGNTKNTVPPVKQLRPHDLDRISSWREQKVDKDDINNGDEKKFLTPQQKRKIAFIHQEFHSDADTVNAYIVFAHAPPAETRPSNLPPPPPIMNPYEAAKVAVEKCDGTIFMERRIRVDYVSNSGPLNRDKIMDKPSAKTGGDPKLSVFVGNLDFASKEDDLRVFFEGIVSTERGPPPIEEDSEDEEDTGEKRANNWVTRVRIVRDKDTQLGKGFAYVQFADRECVDEVLALETAKLKFAKRKLRVQRCKTLLGSSSTSRSRPTAVPGSAQQPGGTSRPVPIMPKGDPALGEKLAHLPKQARKEYKSSDMDRVARRLAKKKARIALEKSGVKPRVKDRRERVRKDSAVKRRLSAPQKEAKRRVRSQQSLAKRNTKK